VHLDTVNLLCEGAEVSKGRGAGIGERFHEDAEVAGARSAFLVAGNM